jgi:hypothetical protein
MADVAGFSLAIVGSAAKIAKNLYVFINKVETCPHIIRALHQILQLVQRDVEQVRWATAELSRRPNASTLASKLLAALEFLEKPLDDFDQKLGSLHKGKPTRLGRLILACKYEACQGELETFLRLINSGYNSLQLTLKLAEL